MRPNDRLPDLVVEVMDDALSFVSVGLTGDLQELVTIGPFAKQDRQEKGR